MSQTKPPKPIDEIKKTACSGFIFRAADVLGAVYEKGTVDVYLRGAAAPIQFRNIDGEAWDVLRKMLLKGMAQTKARR